MRLPRDLSGEELVRLLSRYGYTPTRQAGSHVRLTVAGPKAAHSVTVPLHRDLKIGTLAAILTEIATHLDIDREALASELFKP